MALADHLALERVREDGRTTWRPWTIDDLCRDVAGLAELQRGGGTTPSVGSRPIGWFVDA